MIINEVAELLYTSDSGMVPWDKALLEDKVLYTRTAEVLIDAVAQYLSIEDSNFEGALRLAADLLSNQVEMSRLRWQREAAV